MAWLLPAESAVSDPASLQLLSRTGVPAGPILSSACGPSARYVRGQCLASLLLEHWRLGFHQDFHRGKFPKYRKKVCMLKYCSMGQVLTGGMTDQKEKEEEEEKENKNKKIKSGSWYVVQTGL